MAHTKSDFLMRNLIILTGPRDSGKTSLARRLGLLPWHVDQEALNRLHATPGLNEDGLTVCSGQARRRADDFLMSTVHAKMDKSEFILVEMSPAETGVDGGTERLLVDLLLAAEKHRYATTLVDFSAHSADTCRSLPVVGQLGRKPLARVLTPDGFEARIDSIKNPVKDISHVDAIVAIGDIHGNADALEACLSQARGRGRIAFIFTGDFINKGNAPAQTLRILSKFRQTNPDCFLLGGNHEVMLESWAWRRGPQRDVFTRDTLPDLQASQYSRKEARKFLSKVKDHVRLSWRGYDILATHGGLSAPVEFPGLLPGHLKRFGVGQSTLDIDRVWERNSQNNKALQIHGHRNTHLVDVSQSLRSFNLEGVDSFGQMRGMVLRPDGDGIKAQGFGIPVSPQTRRRKKHSAT